MKLENELKKKEDETWLSALVRETFQIRDDKVWGIGLFEGEYYLGPNSSCEKRPRFEIHYGNPLTEPLVCTIEHNPEINEGKYAILLEPILGLRGGIEFEFRKNSDLVNISSTPHIILSGPFNQHKLKEQDVPIEIATRSILEYLRNPNSICGPYTVVESRKRF